MLQRLKEKLRTFMIGRHGPDVFSNDLVKAGIAVYVISLILTLIQTNATRLIGSLLSYVGLFMMIYSLVRSYSRNNVKRDEENRRYMAWRDQMRTKIRQAKARFKNRKTYKYFKCPGCKSWIRLSRGCGTVTVTCRKCQNAFTKKA